jgi:hypothetical protein
MKRAKKVIHPICKYIYRNLHSLDVLANTLVGGKCHQSLSARLGQHEQGSILYPVHRGITFAFSPLEDDHCRSEAELFEHIERVHSGERLPPATLGM